MTAPHPLPRCPGHGGAPARREEEEPLQLGAQAGPGPGATHRRQLAGGSQETELWWRGSPGGGPGRGWWDSGAGAEAGELRPGGWRVSGRAVLCMRGYDAVWL